MLDLSHSFAAARRGQRADGCLTSRRELPRTQVRTDELLQRQFQAITGALADPAPAVRVVAAAGVCSLLDRYWELMPHATVATYLQRLCGARMGWLALISSHLNEVICRVYYAVRVDDMRPDAVSAT